MLTLLRPNAAIAIDLRSRVIATAPPLADSVIVGRARCGDDVWLLDNARRLVAYSSATNQLKSHMIRGLTSSDQPWGLACVPNHALWMLATPWTLVRVTTDGNVVERRQLQAPWIELFDGGDGLLFEPAPPVIASSLLATSRPTRLHESRPWPGLMVRPTAKRADLFGHNLIQCGLSRGPAIPCWFPGEAEVTLSDGTRRSRYLFGWIRTTGVDRSMPIHDVAFVDSDRIWLLATSSSPDRGRRVAGRLLLTTSAGRELARLDLDPTARLVLAADSTRCILLTSRGGIMEARAQ